jgi:tetratricopeptide (TPR) repeat protein
MSLSHNPQVRSRLNEAQRLLNLGQTQEVERELSELRRKHPEVGKVWLLLASVYGSQGRYRDVVDCCDRVLDINPGNAVAHSLLGSAMACLGQNEKSAHH